ncbi:DUF6493 family protein [Streptosporangium sp. NPDC020072]|uniref:DUF7824 domain-containing protein n=1 Tax=Streptosporangium sp. NPDC020072 TaxID=3154788 RepID=UPI003445D4B8
MTTPWDHVEAAIAGSDTAAIVALVTTLTETDRKPIAARLPAHLQVIRASDDPERRWIEPMRLVGLGTIATPAAALTWLFKRDFTRDQAVLPISQAGPCAAIARSRPDDWRRDFAVRLALRLRSLDPGDGGLERLTLILLRETGAEPPRHDPLTALWIATADLGSLAEDPLTDALLPTIFEAEGAGRLLRRADYWGRRGTDGWIDALTGLAEAGRTRRETLLDGCRSRFLRGAPAFDLHFFTLLHERLAPTDEELRPHLGDYLALLPAAPGPVAELALGVIRRLSATPPADAVEALLFRPEGKLVKVGLSLLDKLLKAGADPDDHITALAVALTCASAGARERAVKLVVAHAAKLGEASVEAVRTAIDSLPKAEGDATIRAVWDVLPPERGRVLAEVFGGDPVPEPEPEGEPFVPPPLPMVSNPHPTPPDIDHPSRLARVKLIWCDWLDADRWLDGFVRLTRDHRRDLVTALRPLAESGSRSDGGHKDFRTLPDLPACVAAALIGLGEAPQERSPLSRRTALPGEVPVWDLQLQRRTAEILRALADDALPPCLLATPTRQNGLIDAGILIERLTRHERAGIEPLPLDLAQALLRLRRTVTELELRKAARLRSAAGRRLHRWLTNRPTDPEVTLTWGEKPTVTLTMDAELEELVGDLFEQQWGKHPDGDVAIFAAHRELAAVAVLPGSSGYVSGLSALVSAEGPVGPAMSLLLASMIAGDYGALDLMRLAATGPAPWPETGRCLAVLLQRGAKPAKALSALRLAAERGAHHAVWEIMAGLLEVYLPGEKPTSAHTRLVAFAADVAGWANAQGELPAVTTLAAGTRKSRLLEQAQRLHRQLTGVGPAR